MSYSQITSGTLKTKPSVTSWSEKTKKTCPPMSKIDKDIKPAPKVEVQNGGVILIQKNCDNGNGRIEDAIILFKCAKTNVCSDGGGRKGQDDVTVEDTARRELLEESCNLIQIGDELLKISPRYHWTNYTCYFVVINENISHTDYIKNLKTLRINNAPSDWRETNGLRKFYLSDLQNSKDRFEMIPDIYGKSFSLRHRTFVAIKGGLFGSTAIQIQQNENLNAKRIDNLESHTFTKNTTTFYIS